MNTRLLRPETVPVVYRDEHLLVLDKPVGIPTTAPDGGFSLTTIAHALDPHAPMLHPLSRLDTLVSGLVTYARSERANAHAMDARANGTLRRAYLGIATRAPEPPTGDWRFAIGFDPSDPKHRRGLREGAKGAGVKAAHTSYRVLAIAGPLVALDLWPRTGRTHQLRVHTSKAGLPLAGDAVYGGIKRITLPNGRILNAQRVMLHCAAFRMPRLGGEGELLLHVDPPADMQSLFKAAGGEPLRLRFEDLTSP